LLRQSPGCTWLLDRDGKFHAAYGDVARVFGRGAEELTPIHFLDLCEPAARVGWSGRLRRVFGGETDSAAGLFAGGPQRFSVTLFPVRVSEGEIAFAGGMAHELPECGLVLRALEVLETDRARLSQLLHDHIGQNLSAAGLQLDLLRMDLADGAFPIPPRVGEIQAALESIMELVRNVNRELNPAVAERIGLRAALDRLAGSLRAEFKGNLRVFVDATAQPPPGPAAALYRIAQEAAGHAARRAGCSAIEILLKSLRNGLALEIHDNAPAAGAGFQAGGLQLMVMQHFADGAGIELQVERFPSRGTTVQALYRCRADGEGFA
jgi:signal transduction histidine kinase